MACFSALFADLMAPRAGPITPGYEALLASSVLLALRVADPGEGVTAVFIASRSLSSSCDRSSVGSVRRSQVNICLETTRDRQMCADITSVYRAELRSPLSRFLTSFVDAPFPASTTYTEPSRSHLVFAISGAAKRPGLGHTPYCEACDVLGGIRLSEF